MNQPTRIKISQLLPILFGFFIMGFVDIVNTAVGHVQDDFNISNSLAKSLTTMVFIWFAVCSLPSGMLMNKIGRKNTVLVSLLITVVAMLIIPLYYSFASSIIAFILLGIGNTILQVSLNPLLTNVVNKEKMTSMLTLGQFVKAICSTVGPLLVSVATGYFHNWKLLFPVYAALTVISLLWLYFTTIEEEKQTNAGPTSFTKAFAMLANKQILAMFTIIILIVGFEIGLVSTIPSYLLEKFSLLKENGDAMQSLYYVARTIGTFLGTLLLIKISGRKFLIVTMLIGILAFVGFLVLPQIWMLSVCLFIIGLCGANVFAIAFASALSALPEKTNEISGLMIMGVAGGALLPPVMGLIADAVGTVHGQWASLFVPLVALVYILVAAFFVIKGNNK